MLILLVCVKTMLSDVGPFPKSINLAQLFEIIKGYVQTDIVKVGELK